MTYCRNVWLFLVAGMQILRGPMGTMAQDNPCPDVFQYEGPPGSEYGIITVPNPYPYLAIDINVDIYITGPFVSTSNTKLALVDRDAWRKLAAGSMDPVLYRLDFPVSSPLPTIKSITVNGNVICSGPMPDVSYLTTVTAQHAIFNNRCSSASLDCPSNIQQSSGGRRRPSSRIQQPPPYEISGPNNVDSSSSTSPCPDVFRYELDGFGEWHGIISVPNPYPVVAIDIGVQLYVTALTSTGNGRLELVNNLKEEWNRMRTGEEYSVQYRLSFPLQSPLPTVKSITVNNRQICRGNRPDSAALTTLSYSHSLFSQRCTSASLECPDNTVQIWQPPTRQPLPPPTRLPPPPPPPPQPTPTPSPRPRPRPPPPTREPPTPWPTPRPTPPPTPPRTTPPQTTPTTWQPDPNTGCGRPVIKTNPLIFGAMDTKPGQWPWHVALYHYQGFNTVYQCGGSFVGTRSVITAAHCVTKNGKGMKPEDIIVYLGRYDLRNRREENTQQIEVRILFVHEEFNHTNLNGDIAILVLNSMVQITTEIRPVCLWNPSDTSLEQVVGKNGVVVGWGLDENGMTADKLKMVRMPVVTQETCVQSNINFFRIYTHTTTFCAGFRNGSSVCNGDSGGGMVFPETQRDGSQMWQLRGIVSNSMPHDEDRNRCNVNNYIIFTDIAPYLGWIDSNMV